MGLQRWYLLKMASHRLPLHLCNSIKQYGLSKLILVTPTLVIRKINSIYFVKAKATRTSNLTERLKLILFLILLSTHNISANGYNGRNSMLRTRVIGTRYGKLQGVILPMDQHKYLKPVEAYLGVPYATPPTGSNRYYIPFHIKVMRNNVPEF